MLLAKCGLCLAKKMRDMLSIFIIVWKNIVFA